MKTISRAMSLAFLCLIALSMLVYTNQLTSAQAEFDCSTVTDIPSIECEALVAFYNSTNGENWDWWGGWAFRPSPCSWEGIGCENGTVTSISAGARGLSGEIPSEIGNLTNLTELMLWYNEIIAIPPEIGNLTKLETLYLNNNQLTWVPSEIGNLTNLEILDLDDNEITELSFSVEYLSSLHQLHLSGNRLTVIPPEAISSPVLSYLSLSNNQLTELPSEIGNLNSLSSLGIGNNPLTSWPETLVNLDLYEFGVESLCEPDQPALQEWLDSMVQGVEVYPRTHVLCSDVNISGRLWLEMDDVEGFGESDIPVSYTPIELVGVVDDNPITITTFTNIDGSYSIAPSPLADYTVRVDTTNLCVDLEIVNSVYESDSVLDNSSTVTISSETPNHYNQNFAYAECELRQFSHTFLPFVRGIE